MQRVEKPWGFEIIWARTDVYVGKKLFIRRGHKLSLQYHREKEETIYLHSGEMRFTVQKDGALTEILMRPGDAYHIPPGVQHRMEAVQWRAALEIQRQRHPTPSRSHPTSSSTVSGVQPRASPSRVTSGGRNDAVSMRVGSAKNGRTGPS